MAIQISSMDGMGAVDTTTGATTGMKANDHMKWAENHVTNSGVVNLYGDFKVVAVSGMNVKTKKGCVYVLNKDWTANQNLQTKYWCATSDAEVTVAIPASHPTLPRKDYVCAKVDPSLAPGSDAATNGTVFVIQGTASASPAEPVIPTDYSYEVLAMVNVAAGVTSISDANIVDRRKSSCMTPPSDGWIPFPSGAYTRATDNSFTCTSDLDLTKFLSKGARLRYYDGSGVAFEYGVITSITSTTATFTGGADYVLSGTPSNLYYSFSGNPVGFPSKFAYTTTATNITVGNATIVGEVYISAEGEATVNVNYSHGSTSTMGTGPQFSLPVNASSALQVNGGQVYIRKVATADYWMTAFIPLGDQGKVYIGRRDGTNNQVSGTVPITWAAADTLQVIIKYKI